MKNIFIALMCFMSFGAYAETTFEISCSVDGSMCNVPVNGMVVDVEAVDMPRYVPMGNPATSKCEYMFCKNGKGEIIGLNPSYEDFAKKPNAVAPVAAPTPPDVSPFNATAQAITRNNVYGNLETVYNIELVVVADSAIINNIVLNKNPKCIGDQITHYPKNISMGPAVRFTTRCTPVELDVTTDSTTWALRFQ